MGIDWTHLHWVDWIIVAILGISTLISLWRGFAREAISLAGWVLAFVVANLFVEQLSSLLVDYIGNVTGRYVLSYVILFVVTLMLAGLTGIMVSRLLHATGLSVMDRVMGTVFGFARGVILVLVVVYVLRQLIPPRDLQWLYQSQLMPQLDLLADWVQIVFADVSELAERGSNI